MDVRDTLNQHPRAVTFTVISVIVVGLGLILWRGSGGSPDEASALEQAFYSTDDGTSWFSDDRRKIYPFDRDGKPAYRAYVFKCGEQGKPFVAYLERFTESARKELMNKQAPAQAGRPVAAEGLEVKKPREAEWVKASTAKGNATMTPTCPDNPAGPVQPVLP
ncbi:MAG TPA: hypothetical protein VER17_14825 [Tepidisphaeraceae bacterium]|nr:hypothetical protein [Tepidisphaeraceae bacterium]